MWFFSLSKEVLILLSVTKIILIKPLTARKSYYPHPHTCTHSPLTLTFPERSEEIAKYNQIL
jgi:hypothetical protein